MDDFNRQRINAAIGCELNCICDSIENGSEDALGKDTIKYHEVVTYINGLLKKMKKPRTCIYKGCDNISVAKSHSIQQESSIRLISKNGHVVGPVFSAVRKGYRMQLIGVQEASTFPGFCSQHEQLFQKFERAKRLSTNQDLILQVFRAICREITIKKIQLSQLREFQRLHNEKIEKLMIEILNERLEQIYGIKNEVSSASVENLSGAQKSISSAISEIETALSIIENQLYLESLKEIENPAYDGLYHCKITIQQFLPMCMAGVGNFWIEENGENRSIKCVLNVLPSNEETTIIASVLLKDELCLNNYLHKMLNRDLGVLLMLESWMITGTDNWFMSPDDWQIIPDNVKAQILEDTFRDEGAMVAVFPYQIFRRLRDREE